MSAAPLWTEAEEDEAWDEGGPAGLARLAVVRYAAEVERLRGELQAFIDDPYEAGSPKAWADHFRRVLADSEHQRVPATEPAASSKQEGAADG